MDLVTEGTTYDTSGATLGELARPHTRPGGSRTRPMSRGYSSGTRIPSLTSGDLRGVLSSGVVQTTTVSSSPTCFATSEMAPSSRSTFNDCLSSIGLPGEEAATFEPLEIEPYEPVSSSAVSTATASATNSATAAAEIACIEPPSSPLTPPTGVRGQVPNAQPSPTAAASAAVASAAPAGSILLPRPPPGAAVQRHNSCRRSLIRQSSQAGNSSSGGTGGGTSMSGPPSSAASSGSACGAAPPAAPRSPLPSAAAAALLPPTPVLSLPEVPVIIFDPTAGAAVAGGGGGSSSGNGVGGQSVDGRATSSFLDPSKPAVRRLLPPLLRASQALQESGQELPTAPGAPDEGAAAGFSLGPLSNRCSGAVNVGGSSSVSPVGGYCSTSGGGMDGWTEPSDATAELMQLQPPPPPLLAVDLQDLPSPRGRRALPPMDPLRTSALSAVSTSDAAEASELATDLGATPTESYSMTSASPYDGSASAPPSLGTARRGGQLRVPWEGEAAAPDGRTAAAAASEAGEGLSGDGDAPGSAPPGLGVLVQRTASFHAVGSGSSGIAVGGSGSAANSISCGGGSSGISYMPSPALLEMARLRTRSAVVPDCMSSLMALSGGGGSSGNGDGVAAPAQRERGRASLSNQPITGPRGGAAAAALPPILDRGDRRQTLTH